jgi:hypothetical protein
MSLHRFLFSKEVALCNKSISEFSFVVESIPLMRKRVKAEISLNGKKEKSCKQLPSEIGKCSNRVFKEAWMYITTASGIDIFL